jgi:thioesterase domain-containing protein
VIDLRALVTLQRGIDRLPFFCVHGAGGNVLNFRDLARALDRARPFHALQAAGLDGVTAPRDSIVEMARAYLREVQDLEPQGPYLIGGYSGGGLVAFEMARLLTAENQRVALLALLDTFHPQMPLRRMNVVTRLSRLRREGMAYLAGIWERRRDEARARRDWQAIEAHLARGEPIPLILREQHLRRSFRRALASYRIQPWSGRAVLFRATQVAYVFQGGPPDYGWGRHVTGGVELVPMPGGHHSLLSGENAGVLGQALGTALDHAEAG